MADSFIMIDYTRFFPPIFLLCCERLILDKKAGARKLVLLQSILIF